MLKTIAGREMRKLKAQTEDDKPHVQIKPPLSPVPLSFGSCTGKNNGFPFLDILGYLNNTHKNPKIWQSETSPNQGIPNQVPRLGLVSLFQIWDFCGYSLNTLKYPKMGIRYFFLCCSSKQRFNIPRSAIVSAGPWTRWEGDNSTPPICTFTGPPMKIYRI